MIRFTNVANSQFEQRYAAENADSIVKRFAAVVRPGLRIAIIAAPLATLFLVVAGLQNRFTVTNQSGQAISFIDVSCVNEGDAFEEGEARLERIPPGKSASARFSWSGHDSFFVADGRLADGTEIFGGGGYVTSGMLSARVHFIVHSEGKVEVVH